MILPIDAFLPEIRQRLRGELSLVLVAPPGTGKTTRVPPALLAEPWLGDGRILLLEPRRLAARAAARRMAREHGEEPGQRFGWRVRHDTCVGPDTRVEVCTEALFVRRIQREPDLPGVGAVIFDEFHERSLDAELGLALLREVRQSLRPDLRLILMSATLAGQTLAAELSASLLEISGRCFPVETRWLASGAPAMRPDEAVEQTLRRVLREETGDVLVFLPGVPEIQRICRRLTDLEADGGVILLPLHGSQSADEQDRVLVRPDGGPRRVILSTSLAEASVTIPGVRLVIDSGLARRLVYDPARDLSRLETRTVTRDAADQRRGRAGRSGPGICWRLYGPGFDATLIEAREPEILVADLSGLALELALWGCRDAGQLAWVTPPPSGPLQRAREGLCAMGALDGQGRITTMGRRMVELPLHPRLARMLLTAKDEGTLAQAVVLAAVLGEGELLSRDARPLPVDLLVRLSAWLRGDGDWLRHSVVRAVEASVEQLRRLLVAPVWAGETEALARLTALAWPERVARLRPGCRDVYLLANGRAALLPPDDALAGTEFLAIADLDAGRTEGRIRLALALDEEELRQGFASQLVWEEMAIWDSRTEAVRPLRRERYGALILRETPWPEADSGRIAAAVCGGIRMLGLSCLPWDRETEQFCARVQFLREHCGESDFPDFSRVALEATLEDWLAPFLDGVRRREQFRRIDLASALVWRLPHGRGRLDRLAPAHWIAPSGSRIRLEYGQAEVPVLAVRLQELFGLQVTPTVCEGRVPVLLHLLSPARRPVQVTRDLAGFWQKVYPEVRRDLRGRYPRHPWPEDPLNATPVRK